MENHVKYQRGNVFFALFGAVAFIGVLGAATMSFMKGPLKTSVTLSRMSVAQTQMQVASQMAVLQASSQTDSGDCDVDGFVEPMEFKVQGTASLKPVGGGNIPNSLGASKKDPWGQLYGYCVWNSGSNVAIYPAVGSNVACDDDSSTAEDRIEGSPNDYDVVLAIISAGPDRTFQTTCQDFDTADDNDNLVLGDPGDTEMIFKTAGSDDVILAYTYAEAATVGGGGLWSIKSSNPGTATISKAIEFTGGLTMGNETAVTVCDATTANSMRYNAFGTEIEVCDGSSWGSLSGGLFELNSGVVRNSGDETTEDFVFGSPQLDDDGDVNHDTRMFFDKSLGAFRAGEVTGTQWDSTNLGQNSTAMGRNTTASGYSSTAMGSNTTAGGFISTAIGSSTTAGGQYSTAMGRLTTAIGQSSTAMGEGTSANSFYSVAMGGFTTASASYSTAMGSNTTASGQYSTAMGRDTVASGSNSTAMGRDTVASGTYSTAMGRLTTASGLDSTAMGFNTTATTYSTAMGYGTAASAGYSTAMGLNTTASGQYSTAMGNGTTASGDYSVAMGNTTSAVGRYSTAMGRNTVTNGWYSTAMGRSTAASGTISTAMGRNTIASGDTSTAMGFFTVAGGIYSTAMGRTTTASGHYSTAMGYDTTAVGWYSTAMGLNTTASGLYSTAMGNGTAADGDTSTAMGYSTTASGIYSTAMGYSTTASGPYSTAMGNLSTAIGNSSTAMGGVATASGASSVAIGTYTTASGLRSLAMGYSTTASGIYSTAMGREVTAMGEGSFAIGLNSFLETITLPPVVTGNKSFGIFMGDQDGGILVSASNTLGLFGGTMVIDPAVPATQLSARGVLDMGAATDAVVFPSGTTAQRPTAVAGMIRYCTSGASCPGGTNGFEVYNGAWVDMGAAGASDIRLKTKLETLDPVSVLDRLSQVQGYAYEFKSSPGLTHYGVIAQELEKIYPELVYQPDNKEEMKSVRYIEFTALLLESVKALKLENESLVLRVNSLDAQQEKTNHALEALRHDILETYGQGQSPLLKYILIGFLGGICVFLLFFLSCGCSKRSKGQNCEE